eukprot:m.170907 g.170907  ORF g.170907 m.170907 type:complete len:145 (-) comp15342_c0_seq8:1109-1543(-)
MAGLDFEWQNSNFQSPLFQKPLLTNNELAELVPIQPRLSVCEIRARSASSVSQGGNSGTTASSSVQIIYNVRSRCVWHDGLDAFEPSDTVKHPQATSADLIEPVCHDINVLTRKPEFLEVSRANFSLPYFFTYFRFCLGIPMET